MKSIRRNRTNPRHRRGTRVKTYWRVTFDTDFFREPFVIGRFPDAYAAEFTAKDWRRFGYLVSLKQVRRRLSGPDRNLNHKPVFF